MKIKVLFSLILFFAVAFIRGEVYNDAELKTGMIYSLCKFISWPDGADTTKPFVISIIGRTVPGKDVFITSDYPIQKRKVVVKRIKNLEEIKDTEVLFITFSEEKRLPEILEYVSGKPILTVGDTKGFGEKGVMINFLWVKGSIKFEINREKAEKSTLQFRSQLFKIGLLIGKINSHEGKESGENHDSKGEIEP